MLSVSISVGNSDIFHNILDLFVIQRYTTCLFLLLLESTLSIVCHSCKLVLIIDHYGKSSLRLGTFTVRRSLMKQSSVKWFGYLFSFIFLIISCAGTETELTQKQINEAYKGKPVSDILVIAITGNEDSRRSFERKFVARLKLAGVEAISSEKAIPMPANLELKKETIINAVNQFENDAVIITHLVGKEVKESYTRGGHARGGYYGFYHSRYSYSRDPGYASTSKTIRLETNLYDVKTEKLIWSGQSKTFSKDSKDQMINDVIRVLVNDLQNNKLITPK